MHGFAWAEVRPSVTSWLGAGCLTNLGTGRVSACCRDSSGFGRENLRTLGDCLGWLALGLDTGKYSQWENTQGLGMHLVRIREDRKSTRLNSSHVAFSR